MNLTDPIADMLTRIRNANSSKHESVLVPKSNVKMAIAKILLEEGWVCAKRIRWSKFQKLTRQEKEEFIKNLPRVSETDISRKPHKLRNTGSDSQTR